MNEVNKMQMIAKVSDGFISHYNISVKTEKKKNTTPDLLCWKPWYMEIIFVDGV